jgi:hypothetical protein
MLVILCIHCGEAVDVDPDGQRVCVNCDRWTLADPADQGVPVEAQTADE